MQGTSRMTEQDWRHRGGQEGESMLPASAAHYIQEYPTTVILSAVAAGFVVGAAIVATMYATQHEEPSFSRQWRKRWDDALASGWNPMSHRG